jgi:hypothetical protein
MPCCPTWWTRWGPPAAPSSSSTSNSSTSSSTSSTTTTTNSSSNSVVANTAAGAVATAVRGEAGTGGPQLVPWVALAVTAAVPARIVPACHAGWHTCHDGQRHPWNQLLLCKRGQHRGGRAVAAVWRSSRRAAAAGGVSCKQGSVAATGVYRGMGFGTVVGHVVDGGSESSSSACQMPWKIPEVCVLAATSAGTADTFMPCSITQEMPCAAAAVWVVCLSVPCFQCEPPVATSQRLHCASAPPCNHKAMLCVHPPTRTCLHHNLAAAHMPQAADRP